MLPIERIHEEFCQVTAKAGCCVLLSAPTGSGKSTRIPRMLAQAPWVGEGTILVVEPRRLAARMLAGFVARQWPCQLGQEVGYTVRFDKNTSKKTRLEFVTDGILERRLTSDPALKGVVAIIFDEVHERRLSGDLCLARALQLQTDARPDLGLVIMSATLELDKLRDYLPQATVLRAEGRLFPVDIRYKSTPPQRDRWGKMSTPPLWEQSAAAIKELITQPDCGDILAFFPGVYEIRRAEEILTQVSWMKGRDVFALHGQLSPDLQRAAVEVGERPRVILSTNIAESSLTIEGVRSVVDCGTARESRWDSRRGISTLHVVDISQAQADQRAGRAGRLGNGYCIRLWSEGEQRRRAPFPLPEVMRADLSAAFLNLLSWGCVGFDGLQSFPWPDAPKEEEAQRAWQLLQDLGAVTNDGGLSDIGRGMLRYPLPPVLSRLMVAGVEEGCEAEMCAIAALQGGESIALKSGLHESLTQPDDFSDFQAAWRALRFAQDCRYDISSCGNKGIMARAAREIIASYRQMNRGAEEPDFETHRAAITRALVHAMPAHVAVRHNQNTHTARLTSKRSGKISAPSIACADDCELFLAAEITEIGGKGVETRLSRCTCLSPDDIDLTWIDEARYDSTRKRVLNFRCAYFRDLLVTEKEMGDAHPDAAAPLLAEQLVSGKLVLSSWDGHVLQWLNRLTCLRQAMPELEMPEFTEEDKLVALSMLCDGAVSYKEVINRQVLPILHEWLSPWQKECLKKYAPKSLKLANGREVKLLYREDGTPSFGLKCQFLFGVEETPTVAEGRVPCLIEILAPNQRPYQVTSDLPSFWARGYAQMKKDLAGRYPRHPWP